MPRPTATLTVVSDSTVAPPAAVAVTVTERFDIPSASEVCAPWVPPSASTDKSMVAASESPIVNDAEPTVSPAAEVEPVIDKASASAATLSSTVVRVKVPDPDDPPAAIVASNESWPDGIE